MAIVVAWFAVPMPETGNEITQDHIWVVIPPVMEEEDPEVKCLHDIEIREDVYNRHQTPENWRRWSETLQRCGG